MSMWEPFTPDARRSIVLAQQAAERFGHNYIGTEHILVGIASIPNGVVEQLLAKVGASAERVRERVETAISRGQESTQPEMVFTPAGKRVIELAFLEARELNHKYIGCEHLLLGVIAEGDGLGARILRELHVDSASIKKELAGIIRKPYAFSEYDHVQLGMPAGKEDEARAFYAGVLGMTEIPKPERLRGRGGVWFASGSVELHLGVDPDFRPAKKAHPGLRCTDYSRLIARLRAADIDVRTDTIPGRPERAFVEDPFGNRLELIS